MKLQQIGVVPYFLQRVKPYRHSICSSGYLVTNAPSEPMLKIFFETSFGLHSDLSNLLLYIIGISLSSGYLHTLGYGTHICSKGLQRSLHTITAAQHVHWNAQRID